MTHLVTRPLIEHLASAVQMFADNQHNQDLASLWAGRATWIVTNCLPNGEIDKCETTLDTRRSKRDHIVLLLRRRFRRNHHGPVVVLVIKPTFLQTFTYELRKEDPDWYSFDTVLKNLFEALDTSHTLDLDLEGKARA